MADPISLGTMAVGALGSAGSTISGALGPISSGMNILGGLTSAGGIAASGQAQTQMLQYQAAVANMNAQIAEQNANYAIQYGESQAQKYGLSSRQQFGQIVAGQAASGLDVSSGSAKQVQESQHLVSTMDLNQIRTNAAKTAYDYQVSAANYRAQAALNLMGAQNTQAATATNVASSLLGTAGSVSEKWLTASQYGLSSGGNLTTSADALRSYGGQAEWSAF